MHWHVIRMHGKQTMGGETQHLEQIDHLHSLTLAFSAAEREAKGGVYLFVCSLRKQPQHRRSSMLSSCCWLDRGLYGGY